MRRRFASELAPRFSDFDMQGIMSSRCYLDFLVEARIDQMVRCYEIPLDHYTARNQTWVFSAVTLSFLRPVVYGTKLVVETEVTSIAGAAAVVEFVFRQAGKDKVFAQGSATYHLIDLATRRPVDVPAREVDVFLSRED